MGQRFLAFERDLAPDFPSFTEVIAVEGAQGADGLVDGGGFESALDFEMDEEVEDLFSLEIGKIGGLKVIAELSDPAEVGLFGARSQAFEVDKPAILLIPW